MMAAESPKSSDYSLIFAMIGGNHQAITCIVNSRNFNLEFLATVVIPQVVSTIENDEDLQVYFSCFDTLIKTLKRKDPDVADDLLRRLVQHPVRGKEYLSSAYLGYL